MVHVRFQDPPQLRGPTIEILGIGEEEAAGDIVLSSAGTCFIPHSTHLRQTVTYIIVYFDSQFRLGKCTMQS